MNAWLVLGVGGLGGLGAIARLAIDGAVSARARREFPYGTLVVNLLGSFVLGVVVGAAVSQGAYRLVGTGLLGAFTTFSTWTFESERLGEDGEPRLGVINLIISLVLGVSATMAGRKIGGWL